MRKINAILGPAMILLFLIHGISGAFQLYGLIGGGSVIRTALSHLLLVLVGIHAVIGIILTVQTLKNCRQEGRSYFKNNERFWISRISGFALLFLIAYHVLTFSAESGEVFRLRMFGGAQLAAHILMALVLLIHLLTNIRPLFIALGLENRKYLKDILIVLSIILLVCAAAFFIYFLRWNVWWKYGS